WTLPSLTRAIELIPQEPAAWANRGLFHLRLLDLNAAEQDLRHAQALAPDSAEIDTLLSLLAQRQGKISEAIDHFRRALQKNPRDPNLLFTLAQALLLPGDPESDTESQRILECILAIQPNNLHALRYHARVALQRKDRAALQNTLARLE